MGTARSTMTTGPPIRTPTPHPRDRPPPPPHAVRALHDQAGYEQESRPAKKRGTEEARHGPEPATWLGEPCARAGHDAREHGAPDGRSGSDGHTARMRNVGPDCPLHSRRRLNREPVATEADVTPDVAAQLRLLPQDRCS